MYIICTRHYCDLIKTETINAEKQNRLPMQAMPSTVLPI